MQKAIYVKYRDQTNSQRKKVVIPGPGVEGNGELLLNSYKDSVWSNENVLGIKRGDGFTPL